MGETGTIDRKAKWRKRLAEIGQAQGFFEPLGDNHEALFIKQGSTLVVSFDNLEDARQDVDRMPEGSAFITAQGWSSLGVMAHGFTWYRDPQVLDFFDRLKRERFFDQFDEVIFYGSSMGGYAACAFSAASPGARVVVASPQATLAREHVDWEGRYRRAWKHEYSGRYGFAPAMIAEASEVLIFYDPYVPLDAGHVSLFQGPQVKKYKCRLFGHGIFSMWRHMGILEPLSIGCILGRLSDQEIYRLLLVRRTTHKFNKILLEYLVRFERHGLVIRHCEAILARKLGGPHYKNALAAAKAALGGKES